MGFQTPITIKATLEKINRKKFLIPEIQRGFVWKEEKIICLFDSLMRDYLSDCPLELTNFVEFIKARERSLVAEFTRIIGKASNDKDNTFAELSILERKGA